MSKSEFNKLKEDLSSMLSKVKAEGRNFTEDEQGKYDEKFARLNTLKALADKEKELAQFSVEQEEEVTEVRKFVTQSPKPKKNADRFSKKQILEDLNYFAKTGKTKEDFALTSGTSGGILMPREVIPWNVTRVSRNAYRRGFELAGQPTLVTSSTENMTVPFFSDSAVAPNNQEGAASGCAIDPSAADGSLDLTEYHSCAVWISNKVVNALDFDITNYIGPVLEARVERAEQIDWNTELASSTVGATTSGTDVTLTDLITLDESLIAYEGTPGFYMVSPTVHARIRTLADTTNRPFLDISETDGTYRLFGKPVVVNTGMTNTMASGVVGMAYISTDGAIIRDTTSSELVRYDRDPNHPGQTGFELIAYSAFAYNPAAVRVLKFVA